MVPERPQPPSGNAAVTWKMFCQQIYDIQRINQVTNVCTSDEDGCLARNYKINEIDGSDIYSYSLSCNVCSTWFHMPKWRIKELADYICSCCY